MCSHKDMSRQVLGCVCGFNWSAVVVVAAKEGKWLGSYVMLCKDATPPGHAVHGFSANLTTLQLC